MEALPHPEVPEATAPRKGYTRSFTPLEVVRGVQKTYFGLRAPGELIFGLRAPGELIFLYKVPEHRQN
jgi:hypothetical protein